MPFTILTIFAAVGTLIAFGDWISRNIPDALNDSGNDFAYGDWIAVPTEFRAKKNSSIGTWGDKAGDGGVGTHKQDRTPTTQRPRGISL